MTKPWDWVCSNAHAIMLGGIFVAVVGVALLLQYRNSGGPTDRALSIGIAGVAVYVVGRVGLVFKGRRSGPRENSEEQ